MNFRVSAVVGNSDGDFDACYDFGDDSELTGTPEEIGAEVTRILSTLTKNDCEEMKYGTDSFYVKFIATPKNGALQESD